MTPEAALEQYNPLLYKLARPYRTHSHYEDILQEGRIALCEAARRFDESRGYQFSTYATPRIRGAISHYLRDKLFTIRLPRGQIKNPHAARVVVSLDDPECQCRYIEPKSTEADLIDAIETRRMVDGLSTKYRPVVLMTADGWTGKEIAAALGVPISTVVGRQAATKRRMLSRQAAML